MLYFSFAGALACFPGTAYAQDGNISYVTARGDTLIVLSSKYLKNPADYRIIQRLNRIANPRLMPIGKRLVIPRSLLKFRAANARISSLRGNVAIGGTAAATGRSVSEGDLISTAGNSFATVTLENGTRISLPSNSQVKVRLLRHYALGGSIDYDFEVLRGGMRSRVSPARGTDDRYRARSPRSVSAVRGTDFQTRVAQETASDFVELDEGSIAVGLGDLAAQPLEAGNGAIFDGQGLSVSQLLPAADMIEAGKTQADAIVSFRASPKQGETGYRYTVASDAGFLDVVSDEVSESDYKLGALEDGNYFLRIRPVASSGLQGVPATHAFRRRLNSIGGTAGKADSGFVFRWEGEGSGVVKYHFQLLKGKQDGVPIIDEAGMTALQMVISDLPPGSYFWRVGAVQFVEGDVSTNWTAFEKFDVSQ